MTGMTRLHRPPARTGPAQAGPAQAGPAQAGPGQAGPAQAGPAQPLVELRGAGVRYPGQPSAALAAMDLAVRHGELVTLTGPAGSGKSALLGIVGLLLRPTTGRYLLNGIDTAALGDGERAALRGRLIGTVFQRPRLLACRSALDNVMLPALYTALPRQRRVNAAIQALDRVGLAARGHAAAGSLSGGEQQQVAIARAIAGQPSLLLCDDPTASLDPDTAARIVRLLAGLHAEGTTILVATADQLTAAHGSRRLVIGTGVRRARRDAGQ